MNAHFVKLYFLTLKRKIYVINGFEIWLNPHPRDLSRIYFYVRKRLRLR